MTFRLGNLGGQRLVYDPQVGAGEGSGHLPILMFREQNLRNESYHQRPLKARPWINKLTLSLFPNKLEKLSIIVVLNLGYASRIGAATRTLRIWGPIFVWGPIASWYIMWWSKCGHLLKQFPSTHGVQPKPQPLQENIQQFFQVLITEAPMHHSARGHHGVDSLILNCSLSQGLILFWLGLSQYLGLTVEAESERRWGWKQKYNDPWCPERI